MKRVFERVDEIIGSNAAASRSRAGIGRADLARTLRISERLLEDYEAGLTRVPAHALLGLCEALGVGLSDLFPPVSEVDHEPVSFGHANAVVTALACREAGE